jgi:nickel/cobalt exporter
VRRHAARLAAVGGESGRRGAEHGLGATPPALGDPFRPCTVNRYSELVLAPGRIQLTYVLDMAEIPTFEELPSIDANHDGVAGDAEKQAWADRKAPEVIKKVRLAVDGVPVTLSHLSDSMVFRPGQAGLPILYFTALFAGPLASSAGSVTFADGNYADRIGWKEITVRSETGVHVFDSSAPPASVSDRLLAYPIDLLSSPLDVRQATFSFRPGPATTGGAGGGGRRTGGAPVASGGAFAALVRWRLTPLILGVSQLLAFHFGAAHALGPGHGKTITAAYLVGAGAKRKQAVAIGGAVSIMHTASVLLLGLVAYVLSKSFPAERVYPWLTLTTGLVAVGLGVGLMAVRVKARRRGLDPWHGHSHPGDAALPIAAVAGSGSAGATAAVEGGGSGHGPVAVLERARPTEAHEHQDDREIHDADHHHPHEPPGSDPVSGKGLLALAVAGGILPSPTAFVVLTGSIYAHRLGYGLGLILAFSVGLASALMGVGMVALRARAMMTRRLGDGLSGLIPIVSAAIIVGFGVFFSARGLRVSFTPSLALAFALGISAAVAGVARGHRVTHDGA